MCWAVPRTQKAGMLWKSITLVSNSSYLANSRCNQRKPLLSELSLTMCKMD